MKVALSLFLIFFSFSIYSQKIVLQDKAMLKIEQEVYFWSDFKDVSLHLNVLSCVYPEAWFLRFISWPKKKTVITESVQTPLTDQLKEHQTSIQKIKMAIMLNNYVERQSVNVESAVYDSLREKLKQQKCEGNLQTWPFLAQTMQAEVFLRGRYPYLNEGQGNIETKDRFAQAQEDLLNNVNNQVLVETLY